MVIYILIVCSFILLALPIVNNMFHEKKKQKFLEQMKETMKKIGDE